jgi:poly(3-hydroxybutyrate) depolymerase
MVTNVNVLPAMKTFSHVLLLLMFTCPWFIAMAQSYHAAPQPVRINPNCGGYYEFLPVSYSDPANAGAKYPLLIDITGSGGEGDGSAESLSKLLNFDAAYFINADRFPDTFYADNNAYSFIVISPQFSSRGNGNDVKAVIDFITARYRIDESRMYVAGYSNGGEPAWSYPAMGAESAGRIAALVPVAAVNTNADHTGANFFVEEHLPVWALHSTEDQGDETSVENSIAFVNAINNLSPSIPAELTLLTGTHRQTMMNVFDPEKKYSLGNKNLNIYEWMLQYQRVSSTLPVALVSFSAAAFDNGIVELTWTTGFEFNNSFFTIEKSGDGNVFAKVANVSSKPGAGSNVNYLWRDSEPFNGVNYYRLSQTDRDGKTAFFNIVSVRVTGAETVIRAYPTILNGGPLKIQVSNLDADKVNIRIIDMSGRLMYKKRGIDQTSFFIPSSSLTTGLNIVEISTSSMSRIIKVLKNH